MNTTTHRVHILAHRLFTQHSVEVSALRFTISAVAGLVGLVLLACAIFGQPELYVREARQQWHTFVQPGPLDATPPGPAPSDQDGGGLEQQVAQLQQQVIQLKNKFSASQSVADEARQQLATLQQQQAAIVSGTSAATPSPPGQIASPQQPQAPADHTAGQMPGVLVEERRDVPRPPPLPPMQKPRADTVAARVEPDDMQAVLARLRQRPVAPGQPTGNQASAEPMNRPPAPSRQRLEMARAALMSGRIDEARRLLQEVQLQLVFRPVGAGDDDASAAAQGASDVARALGVLSGNDPLQSQHFIERAMDEVAGASRRETESASALPGGFAPAYPPR